MKPNRPLLSIVIAIDRFRQRAEAALQSILEQEGIETCEVLLFDFGFAEFSPPKAAKHPSVLYLPMRRGMPMGRWKLLAIDLCQGPIVAFLEEHSLAGPAWVRAILNAHTKPFAAVGGPVRQANPGQGISDLVTWICYERFLNYRIPAREVEYLPGNNSAYKRDVLLAHRDVISRTMAAESLFQQHLVEHGERLLMDPAIVWYHRTETTLPGSIRGLYQWHRMAGFELGRVTQGHLRRLAWGFRFLLLPVARTAKLLWRGIGEGLPGKGLLLRHIPILLRINTASALGLGYGFFFATDNGQATFFNHEMNTVRGR